MTTPLITDSSVIPRGRRGPVSCRRVWIVTGGVALDDEVRLDAEHLGQGGNAHRDPGSEVDVLDFQRTCASALTQAGLDTVQAPERGVRRAAGAHRRHPALACLDRLDDLGIALGEIGQDVVVVQ